MVAAISTVAECRPLSPEKGSPNLRTGIVGAGVFGGFHANKHAASPRAVLVGVCDTDEHARTALAQRLGVKAYDDLDALFAEIDAVTVATPAETHFDIARRALEAGLHVYVEKPLAMNVADADALIALAAEKGLVLQVGHQERFVLAAIGLPESEAPPLRLELSRCGPPSGRGEDVSVVFDLMVHDLDIARLFGFGAPARVSASGDRDETIATLHFEKSRQASFIASRKASVRRRLLKAVYESHEIEIDFIKRHVVERRGQDAPRMRGADGLNDPLGVSVEAFFSSVIDGARTMVDGKAGRRAIEWAFLIEEARDRLNSAAPALDRKIA